MSTLITGKFAAAEWELLQTAQRLADGTTPGALELIGRTLIDVALAMNEAAGMSEEEAKRAFLAQMRDLDGALPPGGNLLGTYLGTGAGIVGAVGAELKRKEAARASR